MEEEITLTLKFPYAIGEELYWLYKEKIVKTKVAKYVCWGLLAGNNLRVDMQRPEINGLYETLDLNKVFKTKEDLVESISA